MSVIWMSIALARTHQAMSPAVTLSNQKTPILITDLRDIGKADVAIPREASSTAYWQTKRNLPPSAHRRMNGSPIGSSDVSTQTLLVWVNSSRPSCPNSRPWPLSFRPPNGEA